MMTSTASAKQFTGWVPIYRQRYLEYNTEDPQGALFAGVDTRWTVAKLPLSDIRIERAVNGEHPAGYYAPSITNAVAVDIDDHTAGGWLGNHPTATIKNKYNAVKKELGDPSFVVRTPRGIHVYYLLTMRLPTRILKELAKDRLQNVLKIEIKPDMYNGLRFPVLNRMLDSDTLQPRRYKPLLIHPAILFDDKYTQDYQRGKIRDFGAARLRLQTARLVDLEGKYLPSKNNTNESLIKLSCIYRTAGLTLEEACDRFTVLLRSAGYQGELNNAFRLRQRMASSYRHAPDNASSYKAREIQPGLFDAEIVDYLVDHAPFATQRKKPLRRFLAGILDWINYQDQIWKDPDTLTMWSYIYPYYRKNREQGLYPIPRSILQRLNDRYNTIMPHLTNSGFLIPADFRYSHLLGVCKYYRVETDVKALKDKGLCCNMCPHFLAELEGHNAEKAISEVLKQNGPMNVKQISALAGVSERTVWRKIPILEQLGAVKTNREGRRRMILEWSTLPNHPLNKLGGSAPLIH